MMFLALATATAPLCEHADFALLNCVAVCVLFVAAFASVWFFASDGVVSLVEVMHRLAILVLVLTVLSIALPKAAASAEALSQGSGRFQGFFNNPNGTAIFRPWFFPSSYGSANIRGAASRGM